MKFSIFAATIFACTLSVAAAVSAKPIDCSIKANSASKGWIADRIGVFHVDGEENFRVMDGIIHRFNDGKDTVGRIDVDNAKRTTYVWEIQASSSTKQPVTVQYRMTVQKKNGAVNLTAQPLGYKGPYTARGSCKAVKR